MDKNLSDGVKAHQGIAAAIRLEAERRKKEPKLLLYDAVHFAIAFVFVQSISLILLPFSSVFRTV